MHDTVLMGIDLGAGSLKVTIIDTAGALLGSASSDVRTNSPQPGWAEQDPEEWYRGLCHAVPAALAIAGIKSGDIGAVSFSAGAHTPVLLDEDNQLIRPAILWSDQRSSVEAHELAQKAGAMIHATSFNNPAPTWTLPQLQWLQTHEPDSVRRTKRLLIAKDYLRFRLTGGWHTDRVDAVGTLMTDSSASTWSEELCALIGWNMETLPPIVEPAAVVGEVSRQGAEESGLAAGTPVVAGTMDTAAECYGAGAVDAGHCTIKLATAGTVSVITDTFSAHAEVIDYPHVIPGYGYAITGTNSCASAHRWLRDQLFMPADPSNADGDPGQAAFNEMERLAASIPAGSDGMLFHPYLQGERSPYWDAKLRADFIGVTIRHTKGHFVRALYEGVAFSLLDCMESLNAQGLQSASARLVGGGGRSATWRQIVSDCTGLMIDVPENGDASFGAALVAGVGIGAFNDERDAVKRCVKLIQHHEPDAANHALYGELFAVYKDAQAALSGINHTLTDLMVNR